MARRCELLGKDLARPAKELPLKTIKTLGYLLHTHLHNSGNWETVAEDLGYCYEAIKQFSTNANVRQDCTPGELMLRDWIGRGTGRTLFVLRNALNSSDRCDCVEFLDQEINDKVLHMDLQVCIADADGTYVNYQPIRTKTDASLRDSLQNALDGPIRNYQLADSGVSWDSTIAREYKGQELKIYRLTPASVANQEQDPTVDSSSQSSDCTYTQGPPAASNELGRSTNRKPDVCCSHNLNIPTSSGKISNVPKVESSQHCHSCTCEPRTQTSPGVLKRSVTIYDDQEVTKQEIRQMTQRPESIKLDTSIFSSAQNSDPFCIDPYNCVTSSNNLVQDHRIDSLDSMTAQKQLTECGDNTRNVNFRHSSDAHASKTRDDSITQQKAIFRSNRNVGNLVDYTPSSSGSDTENWPFSGIYCEGNQTHKLEEPDSNEAVNHDLPEYSYAVYNEDSESHMHGENYAFAVESPHADSSMDTHVTNERLSKHNNEIKFVNTEYDTDEQYQDWSNKDFVSTNLTNTKDGGFQSEMDCQSLTDMTEIQISQNKNVHPDISNKASNSEAVIGLDMDTTEIDEPTYKQQLKPKNTQMFAQNSASNADITDFVDDSAIQVVNEHDIGDIYNGKPADISAIHVNDSEYTFNDLLDDSLIHVSGEKDNINDLVDDSAIQVVNLEDINNSKDFVDDSAIQGVSIDKDRKSQMLDIYASSVIPGLSGVHTVDCKSKSKPGSLYPYESLQRFVSCPNEFGYEEPNKEIKFQKISDNIEMPTIADSFTPVTEHLNLQDFLTKSSTNRTQFNRIDTDNMPTIVHSLGRAKREKTPIQMESMPNRRSCTDMNRIRHNDNTCMRNIMFQQNISKLENRPLPPPPSTEKEHLWPSRKSPPLLPPKIPKMSPHPYKLVSGGKTSRPMLDNLLANDRLFIHYNSCLQGYPGWSPRETEYTVEKTLQSVVKSNGYYLFWYIRGRRRLAVSISHMGKVVHYEVRTKVDNGQLHYYIFPDTVYSDIRLLLQYHESHGLRPQTEQEGTETGFISSQNARDSRRHARYSHVFMRCPVLVEYGPRQAFSV